MQLKQTRGFRISAGLLAGFFLLLLLMGSSQGQGAAPAVAVAAASPPRVNIPKFTGDVTLAERAVFWFGAVQPTQNHTQVRIGYNDESLVVQVAVFDRLLYFSDPTDSSELTDWDAATLYLDVDGAAGSQPDASAFRLVGKQQRKQSSPQAMAMYQGNGSGWTETAVSFDLNSGWRATGIDDQEEDRGWWVGYVIPFSALGLSGPPAAGTIWGMGVAVHDRDDAAGSPIADQVWPTGMQTNQPGSWAEIHFGMPTYTPPTTDSDGSTTIRQGLNGATVMDAHVGGHSICGSPYWPDRFFSDWGNANYAGYQQINVQNQFDLADWPCFSRYYVRFPLTAVPSGKVIVSATMSMYHFGNAGQGGTPPPEPSLLQLFTLTAPWDEATVTWNNGPQMQENVSASWADPLPAGNFDQTITWDVSRAVAAAYENGQPLDLALYSADSAQHSGKYFISSDGAAANPERRPTLVVTWAEPPLTVMPKLRSITPGGTAAYTIQANGFSNPVTLSTSFSDPNLTLSFSPKTVQPGGTSTLTVTDLHGALPAGIFYTIPISATDGSETRMTEVTLLVGGQSLYLPVMRQQ